MLTLTWGLTMLYSPGNEMSKMKSCFHDLGHLLVIHGATDRESKAIIFYNQALWIWRLDPVNYSKEASANAGANPIKRFTP